MSTVDRATGRAKLRVPGLGMEVVATRFSEWRWRLGGIVLVGAYLAQDALGLKWVWLGELQTVDVYKYATGSILLAYLGWQWYLFLARLKGRNSRTVTALHQRSVALAPILFYAHSVQTGYGYLAILSWVFLGNLLVGSVSPVGLRVRSRAYMACWGAIHVTLAVFAVALGLYHAYIAVYYK